MGLSTTSGIRCNTYSREISRDFEVDEIWGYVYVPSPKDISDPEKKPPIYCESQADRDKISLEFPQNMPGLEFQIFALRNRVIVGACHGTEADLKRLDVLHLFKRTMRL